MKKNLKQLLSASLVTSLLFSNLTLASEFVSVTTLPFYITSGSAVVVDKPTTDIPVTTLPMTLSEIVTTQIEPKTVDTAITNALGFFSNTKYNLLLDYSQTLAILSSKGNLDGYTLPNSSTIADDTNNMVSSLSTKIIILNAIGQDPRNTTNGRNLVDELIALQDENGLFANSYASITQHMFAMIALNNSNGIYDTQKAIDVLNNFYTSPTDDWGYAKRVNTFGNADTAGFALMALAPYKELDTAKKLIGETVSFLQKEQLEDGGFAYDTTSEYFYGNSNSNSTGTVISGLIAIGEDVDNWIKNGKTPIDVLLTFQNTDGGFFYEQGYNNDDFSFNQSLMALGDYKNKVQVYNTIKDQTYKVTKSDLLIELNKANTLNKSSYTTETIANLEQNLIVAQGIFDNELATDDDIYLATSLVRYSLINLEPVETTTPSNKISVTQEIVLSKGDTILPLSTYSVESGSTVFDVLKNSLAQNGITFEYTGTGSNVYVSRIGNYVEFGAGVNSGFEYYVNGIKKSVSSAIIPLNNGDTIKWVYTSDYTTSTQGVTKEILPTTTLKDNIKINFAEISSPLDLSNLNFTLESIYTSYLNKETLSNFEQIFIKYFTGENNLAIINSLTSTIEGTYRKPTDLAKTCLALQLYDQDITDINGVNLYSSLKNYENLGKQGVNGYIYALFVATNQNDQEFANELIIKILQYQNEDGGFSLDLNNESDIDITAMAMQALSSYTTIQEVNDSIYSALLFTQEAIKADISSESISQILLALTMLNLDIHNASFVTDNNLLERLMTFKYTDYSFYHTADEMYSDDISTEQAALALIFIAKKYENNGDTIAVSGPSLSRLEFLTKLAMDTDLEVDYTLENVFTDLNDNALTTYIINTWYKKGVTKGTLIKDKLYFNGDDLITKQDASVFLARHFDLPQVYINVKIADYDKISSYAKPYVDKVISCFGKDILFDDNSFIPTLYLTNDDFIKIINYIQK